MRKNLLILLIIFSNLFAFAQIDTSAWKGKTVLVVMETEGFLTYNHYQHTQKEFQEYWYLTDSVEFMIDTLIKRDLDDFGKDTVVISWRVDWIRTYTDRNCLPPPENCLIWMATQRFKFKNFQNNNWENYTILFYGEKEKPIQKFQKAITTTAYLISYTEKTKLIKNVGWSKEVKEALGRKFENANSKIIETLGKHYTTYQNTDAVWIDIERGMNPNYIEIIHLQTHRVEKVKLKKIPPKLLIYLEDISDSTNFRFIRNTNPLSFTNDVNLLNRIQSFNQDTLLIIAEAVWVKSCASIHCDSTNYNDLFSWYLSPKYKVYNTFTEQIDEYIWMTASYTFKYFITDIQRFHVLAAVGIDLSQTKIFVDSPRQSVPKIEAALTKRLGTLDNVGFVPQFFRRKALTEDWIYVLPDYSNKIQLIDLQTNRVIETLELETE